MNEDAWFMNKDPYFMNEDAWIINEDPYFMNEEAWIIIEGGTKKTAVIIPTTAVQ